MTYGNSAAHLEIVNCLSCGAQVCRPRSETTAAGRPWSCRACVEAAELTRLRAELAYAHERLRNIVDLIECDPEANDPSTDLYVEINLAKAVVYPAEPTPSEGSEHKGVGSDGER